MPKSKEDHMCDEYDRFRWDIGIHPGLRFRPDRPGDEHGLGAVAELTEADRPTLGHG